VRHPHSDALV
jgi:hypothetical protein